MKDKELIWIPEGRDLEGYSVKQFEAIDYAFTKEPIKATALLLEREESKKPLLPLDYKLEHWETCFHESTWQDMYITPKKGKKMGTLKYTGCVRDGGFWLLLTFKEKELKCSCGGKLEEHYKFCTSCGKKV